MKTSEMGLLRASVTRWLTARWDTPRQSAGAAEFVDGARRG
jgi:hypothetical protein